MSKRTKAYTESKLFRNPVDNRKAFYAGWDAALRTVPVCVKCGNKGEDDMSIEAMRVARLVLSETKSHPLTDAKQYEREMDAMEILDDAIADAEERTWVSLTDEDITLLWCDYDASQWLKFVRNIEQCLKEKNH